MTPHCDAFATGRAASAWGFGSLPCQRSLGLRTLVDSMGVRRRFCASPAHEANVVRRFGRSVSEEERVALAIERISRDFTDEVERNPEGDPTLNGAFG
jgi:hypothetical protein